MKLLAGSLPKIKEMSTKTMKNNRKAAVWFLILWAVFSTFQGFGNSSYLLPKNENRDPKAHTQVSYEFSVSCFRVSKRFDQKSFWVRAWKRDSGSPVIPPQQATVFGPEIECFLKDLKQEKLIGKVVLMGGPEEKVSTVFRQGKETIAFEVNESETNRGYPNGTNVTFSLDFRGEQDSKTKTIPHNVNLGTTGIPRNGALLLSIEQYIIICVCRRVPALPVD